VADHVRKQLRSAVTAAVTGLATTGARVHESRIYPINSALPCLLVYASDESAEGVMLDESADQRTIEVRIEGLAQAAEGTVDEILDQIAKEVEIALAAPVVIGAFQTNLSYTGATMSMRDDLAKPVGSVALSFEAVLFTSAPDVIIGA
jgi:hypothetical protein